MFRSEKMTHLHVYLQSDAAFEVLDQLGEIGCVQFIDMTPDVQLFKRKRVREIFRCLEFERKLRSIEYAMKEDYVPIPKLKQLPKAMQLKEMYENEVELDKLKEDVSQMTIDKMNLQKHYLEMIETAYIMSHVGPLLGDVELRQGGLLRKTSDAAGDLPSVSDGSLAVLTGVVPRLRSHNLELMLWRIGRGSILYRQSKFDKNFPDPAEHTQVRKVAFLIMCQGQGLNARVLKVCKAFHATIYPCPKTVQQREDLYRQVTVKSRDLEQVIKKTTNLRRKALQNVAVQYKTWLIQIKKTKAIYHNMNLFNLDVTKNCLIGKCWSTEKDVNKVRKIFEDSSIKRKAEIPSFVLKIKTTKPPPTYQHTNKFTHPFQVLIDSYGIAAYRELNPAIFATIIIPALFSFMYADIFHGFVLFAIGFWLIINEKKFMRNPIDNDIWKIFFAGRYIILLLGLFSMYSGFIFNSVLAKSFWLTKSYWVNTYRDDELKNNRSFELSATLRSRDPYKYGVDPMWSLSNNYVAYMSSLKMKMAIIIGVLHILFGYILCLFNHISFKRYVIILLRFLPEFLFFTCLFVWLVFLMFYKWFYYGPKFVGRYHVGCAPEIILIMIKMLVPWAIGPRAPARPGPPRYPRPPHRPRPRPRPRRYGPRDENVCKMEMFESQKSIQVLLTTIVMCSVIVHLLGMPLYKYARDWYKKLKAMYQIHVLQKEHPDDKKKIMELKADLKKYRPLSELLLIQGIRTVEFVLSSITHVASYLRLWALSLAHSLLGQLLWNVTIYQLALDEIDSHFAPLKLVCTISLYAFLTMVLLVAMDGVSLFLHALRLYWVEFMSTFYAGTGFPFEPFCFKHILKSEEDLITSAYKYK